MLLLKFIHYCIIVYRVTTRPSQIGMKMHKNTLRKTVDLKHLIDWIERQKTRGGSGKTPFSRVVSSLAESFVDTDWMNEYRPPVIELDSQVIQQALTTSSSGYPITFNRCGDKIAPKTFSGRRAHHEVLPVAFVSHGRSVYLGRFMP